MKFGHFIRIARVHFSEVKVIFIYWNHILSNDLESTIPYKEYI